MITIIFMDDSQIIIEDVKSHISSYDSMTIHITVKDGNKYIFPLINVKYVKIEK